MGGLFKESTYVSQKALQNLKLYKYASVDRSPTTKYILRYYWDWAVGFFPLWMAADAGSGRVAGSVLRRGNLYSKPHHAVRSVICHRQPHMRHVVYPRPQNANFVMVILQVRGLVLLEQAKPVVFSAGLWLYSTFDNVDGRQARRTKTSSPLGELFDHGCDALNCSLGSIVQAAAMGFGHSWYSAFLLLLTTMPFYLSTWEEYHTGVLYLGYVNGPTEGLIFACTSMALSGVYGPAMWFTNLRVILGSLSFLVPTWIPANFTLADSLCAIMTGALIFMHCPACFWGVYKSCRTKNQSFIRIAIIQNIPMTIYGLAGYFWLRSPYSYIFSHQHFIIFALSTGIVFGRMATKIILAHVTKMKFPMFTILLGPLVVGSVIVNLPVLFDIEPIFTPESEHAYLWAFFIFALIAYFNWAWLVIHRFCTFLGIRCLTIPYAGKDQVYTNGKPKVQ
ncbi:hypothetical protein BC936DRAFT_145516 [Jimgerdemannia flammicorona]|uniref:CDP-alcohol phosphatidyltransferase-domain-containing protein n=1 Tax=Jimgerdemannia flammicorona TaxID=994334 RepID=A0A433D9V4_9FUNG|nr:hypothetical protein BC936DRAFT_145516 [Jimgerdemannia flammicorona]